MAEKIIIPLEVKADNAKSDLKEVSGDISKATTEQTLFTKATAMLGAAMNTLKGGVRAVIMTFKTLKGAIAATGIGLLVIALGSLVSYFTSTQRGADKLSEVMAGLGAAVDVIVDRISGFGESLFKLFTGDVKGAVDGMKGTFAGLGDEIAREAMQAAELTKQLNQLRDVEREFSVQKAKNNVIIREAEAASVDESIALGLRLEKMEEALRVTMEQAAEEERLAQIKFDSIKAQVGLGESLTEDLDKQAQAEIELINIRAQRARTEKRLLTQVKTLRTQYNKEVSESEIALERSLDGSNEAILLKSVGTSDLRVKNEQETGKKLIDTRRKTNKELEKSEKALAKATAKTSKDNTDAQLAAAGNLAGALGQLAGDSKGLAVAEATISTYLGATKALAAGAGTPIGYINAAAIIATGLANVKTILSTKVEGEKGGAGGVPSGGLPSMGSGIAASVPASIGLNDVVNSIEGQNNAPMQAYVIGQEVTDSQEAQMYINNQRAI